VDMQDKDKALRLRASLSEHYDIPDEQTFLSDIGFADVKKKDDSSLDQSDMDLQLEEDSSDISPEISKEYEKSSFQAKDYLGEFLGGAIDAGVRQGKTAEETMELIYKGKKISDEELQSYVAAVNRMKTDGPSKDMMEFQEIAAKNGGGITGFITGLKEKPEAALEVALTSFAGMITAGVDAKEELAAGTGAVAATGAGLGAVFGGGFFTPVTASAGAISGTIAGAMGTAGGLLETSMSYTEFLSEELEKRNLEFNPENIRTVLNDEDAIDSIRNRSLARGAIIGVVDAMTAGLSGAAAKSVTKTVGNAATTTGRIAKKTTALTAAGGVEAVGGGTGEAVARLAVGQDMDINEIGFEAIGGAPKGLITGPVGIIRAGKQSGYSINGQTVTKAVMDRVLKTSTPQQLSEMDISIQNDETSSAIYKTKKDRYDVEQSLPDDIPDSNREEVIDLELKKKSLEGKNSVSAKSRIKAIEKEIVEKSQPVEQDQVTEQEQPVEQEQTVEQEQAIEQEATVEDVESTSLDYATKTTGISTVDANGKFVGVTDKKAGRAVTSRKSVESHQDNLIKQRDYSKGKSAIEVTGETTADPSEVIANYSENPKEIALAFQEEKSKGREYSSDLHQRMSEDGVLVNPKGVKEMGGFKNPRKENPFVGRWLGSEKEKTVQEEFTKPDGTKGYRVTKEPAAQTIDQVAKTYGVDVQEVYDLITSQPYTPPKLNSKAQDLRSRFIEVTGLLGTEKQLEAVATQDPSKLEGGVLSKKEQTSEDFKRAKEEQEFIESQQEEQTKAVEQESKTRLESLVADTFLEPVIKRIQDSTRKFYKTHLSAKGYMTEEMNRYREIRNGGFARDLGRVKRTAKQFNRLTKGMTDEQKAQVMEDLNDILHGRVDRENSPLLSRKNGEKIIEIGERMRIEIDSLSHRLVDTNLPAEESIQNILDNVGKYVNRSYRLFETPDWKDNVKEEVVEAARAFIKSNNAQLRRQAEEKAGVDDLVKATKNKGLPVESLLTDKQLKEVDQYLDKLVEEEIQRILNKSDKSEYVSQLSTARASLRTGVLEQRNNNIPLEIQDLMGRIDNPLDNYLNTIKKLSLLVNNAEFQLNLLKMGGAGVFSDVETAEFSELVAEKGSKTYPFLAGKYARPEIAALFKGEERGKDKLSNLLLSNNELLVQIGGTVKGLKTVGSIGTHFKNLLGNLGFVVLNGHANIKEFKSAASLAYKSVGERFTSEEQAAIMDEYRSLGLIGQSVTLGDVKAMFGQESFEQAMESSLSDPKKSVENQRANAFSKLLGSVKKKFGGTIETFESAYQAEDDLFKIVAYEVEKSRHSEALFSKDYSQLTEDQKKEVNNAVVEIVKNTYPTYDRVPPLFKKIGKSPLIGAFISFQAESVRTMVNSFRIAKQQLNSDNPKIRSLGANRMISFGAYSGLQTLMTLGLMQAGKTAIGLALKRNDDEDEPVEYDDIRKFMPPWSKNSNVSVFETETPGVYNVLDLSSNNPHSLITNVMKAGTQDSGKNHFIEAVSAALVPFLGKDLIAATTIDLVYATNNGGITADGKRIYNPEDSDAEAVSKMALHVGELFLPGTITSGIRIGEGVAGINDREAKNEMLGLIGFRPYKVDVSKQLKYSIYKYKEDINSYKSSYSRANRKNIDNYNEINESMKESNRKMHQLIVSAQRLGVDATQIMSILKETRVGKSEMNQLLTGVVYDYIPRR